MARSIAYFITAHGYGHAVRSSYLINSLGQSNRITIFSGIPKLFFDEELSVPFEYEQVEFDSGCVQIDALTIDTEATIETYKKRSAQNGQSLSNWIEQLRNLNCDCIVSDVVPFAGVIASHLNIPSVAVSNFWWSDIYNDLPRSEDQRELCEHVESEMNSFTHLVVLNPAMRKWEGSDTILTDVNLIRVPRNRSEELRKMLGIDSNKHLALLYTGNYGMDSVQWELLPQLDQWHFIGLHPIPGNPSNFTLITKEQFTMQEFTASVDIVISKLGYGTVTESLASGTPLLYTPREGFSEFPVLESYLKPFGHTLCIEENQFNALQWSESLQTLLCEGKREVRIQNDTDRIAQWILDI